MRHGLTPEIDARSFMSLNNLRKAKEGFDLAVVDTRGLADDLTLELSKESK